MAVDALPPLESQAPRPERPSTAGRLVYAVGDVHGCYDLFRELLARCWEDSRGRSSDAPLLVLCGDYVDRGPDSPEVLEAVLQLRERPEFELRALKGNHEQGMLAFLDDPTAGRAWLMYGGAATLESYGVSPPDSLEAGELQAVRDRLAERLPAAHLELLRSLELSVVQGDYAFVHAGVRPGAPLDQQSERDLLWIRDEFLRAPPSFEKVIVHGHTWVDHRPQLHEHRIGVDTGAFATGVLTAVRLDEDGAAFLQTAG